jgi:hypothetical protein
MEDGKEFPVEIIIEDAGIGYVEAGPSKAFISAVVSGEEADIQEFYRVLDSVKMTLIMTIGDGGLDTQFTAMSYGKVLFTVAVSDALEISAEHRRKMYDQ